MPQTYYDTPMVARPYITYYDANGNLRTYYYTEEQKWSDETKTGFSGGGYAVSYIKAIETMLDIIKNDSEHIVFGESYPYEDYEEALEFMQKIYDTYIEQNGK
jgi:cellulose biosynthesis protein BcsQ